MAIEENKEGEKRGYRQKRKGREKKGKKRRKRRKGGEAFVLEIKKQDSAREEQFPQKKSVSGLSSYFFFSCFEFLRKMLKL